jgi:hypothetical protein
MEACEKQRRDWLRDGVVPADYPDEVAEDWPDLIEIVRRRVKPERDKQKRDALRERWWQYAEKRPGMVRAIGSLNELYLVAQTAPHVSFAVSPVGKVYGHTLIVFALEGRSSLCALQSRAHEVWTRRFAASMKDDQRYLPEDCFRTFPFPANFEANIDLEKAGEAYHTFRAELMISRNEGLTQTYNRFHDSREDSADISRLRTLHNEMDVAVLHAYGWDDLAAELRAEFLTEHTEDDHTYQGRYFWNAEARDLVLARLLALNAERHAEEVEAGLVKDSAPSTILDADEDEIKGFDTQCGFDFG